jgi:hypothetical protein
MVVVTECALLDEEPQHYLQNFLGIVGMIFHVYMQ